MEYGRQHILIFGYLYVFTSLFYMIISVLNIYILLNKIELLKKNFAYILITLVCMSNLIQLISHFCSGFYVIFLYSPTLRIDIIQGSILNFGYDMTCILNLALSSNRLFVFFKFYGLWKLFIKTIAILIITILSLASIAYLILSNFDFFRITFNEHNAVWDYYTASENFYRFNGLESRLMVFTNLCSAVVSMLIILQIIIQKLSFSKEFSGGKIKFYDLALFIQAIINFICIGFVQVFWQYGSVWFPDSTYLYTYLNYLWLHVGGKDSLSSLLLLSEIRVPVLILLRLRKNVKIMPAMTTSRNFKNNIIA
uniref:7TM_GPCR_Srx domain-containing protein n=1 Tax=Strongyloides stercoralis TaxID=6248 RepID=A0A0K0EBI9_STRER